MEAFLKNYLENKANVPAFLQKTDEYSEYVVVEKTGSSNRDGIFSATFAIQSFSDSAYKASLLNEKIKKIMKEMTALKEVNNAELETDYPFHDLQRKRYRYQAVYTIYYVEV